ncbi:hypothetical protein EV126DRAFT_132052 [Verticillium dahliae]|nr:hypothetical protein EV126DRAFT_132052 [Verticillium dahliae]
MAIWLPTIAFVSRSVRLLSILTMTEEGPMSQGGVSCLNPAVTCLHITSLRFGTTVPGHVVPPECRRGGGLHSSCQGMSGISMAI